MSRTSRTNAPLLRATLALFAGLSVILSHGTGRAAAPSGPGEAVDRWLQRAALARGDAYATLLGELDALSPDARAVLASRAAGLGYTHATWRDDALVAIAHVRVTRPDLVRRFEALDDLRPARYLAKRRPEPEAGRALARLPADAAPLFLDVLVKGTAAYPLAAADQYPVTLDADARAALGAKERLALVVGAVDALAASGHPAARHALESAATDDTHDEAVRRAACAGLARVASDAAIDVLATLARDVYTPAAVRTGAIAALGDVRSARSLDVLLTLGATTKDGQTHAAIVTAVGALASASVLARRPDAEARALSARAGAWLVDALVRTNDDRARTRLVEALTTIATPATRALVAARLDAARTSPAEPTLTRALARIDHTLARRR